MTGPRFFLSYARNDRPPESRRGHDPILKLFTDLCVVVRRRLGVPRNEEPGFLDVRGIEPGADWPHTLHEALRTTATFVAIVSPSYVSSQYCGKEWAAFSSRLTGGATVAAAPGLIQPVMLTPAADVNPLPAVMRPVQHGHESYPAVYGERGLAYLSAMASEADSYSRFVEELADKLIRAQKNQPLPAASALPPLAEVDSAFHDEHTQLQRVDPAGEPGRRLFAQFVFVAARADEMQSLRTERSAYGPLGGLDWQPYQPPSDTDVDEIANKVSLTEGYRYDRLRVTDAGLTQRVSEAVDQRKVVVVIVDPWTIRLARYRSLMAELDRLSLPSCVILIPVNSADAETVAGEELLRTTLEETFVNRHLTPDPDVFVTWVGSRKEFETRLAIALGAAKMRIIRRYEVTRRAVSAVAPVRLPLVDGSDTAITA